LGIIVSKNGYTSVKRGLIFKSGLNIGNQTINKINFGGIEMPNDSQFALKKN